MISSAEFSPDGLYRYVLYRRWDNDPTKKIACCIGLNPSNAGSLQNDPTISRLITTLKHLGYAGFYMTNLYGLISSDPKVLRSHPNPWGDNNKWVALSAISSQEIIFCWGGFKEAIEPSKHWIKTYPDALCFWKTSKGAPWHPLAMMYAGIKVKDAKLERYNG